jgi:hypothetical protein
MSMRRFAARTSPKSVPRRGDALKTVLIVIAILGALMLLTCVGGGVAAYVWLQRTFSNVAVSDPVKIRQMTSDLTDITIPAEFVPQTGSQFLGMHSVSYQWCPSGTCPIEGDGDQAQYNAGTLTLTTFQSDELADEADDAAMWEESFSESNLQEQYRNFTKEVKEVTIRGKPCKFYIVKGEEIPWDGRDEDVDMADAPAEPAVATEPVSEPAAEPPPPAKPGRQIVWVQGSFPGKKGQCTLNVYLLSSDYDETKIGALLQSIK